MAVAHGPGDHGLSVGPEIGAAFGDVGVAGEDAVGGDAVFFPRGALGRAIQQHRMKAVHGGGEFGLGGLAGFKLIPERAELGGLTGWQESKNAVGGEALARVLVSHVFRVVGKRVAGVDFDEVVDDHHFERAEHVEVWDVGVLGEGHHQQAKAPGMFGVVFGATADGVYRLPENVFELIDLDDEGDLARETFERSGAHGFK